MTDEEYNKLTVEHERLSKQIGCLNAALLVVATATLIVAIVAWVT